MLKQGRDERNVKRRVGCLLQAPLERSGKRILAQPLSIDQTPYRKDERDRVKAQGAMILTQAMIMEDEEYVEGWDDIRLEGGEDDDGSGDPPRI